MLPVGILAGKAMNAADIGAVIRQVDVVNTPLDAETGQCRRQILEWPRGAYCNLNVTKRRFEKGHLRHRVLGEQPLDVILECIERRVRYRDRDARAPAKARGKPVTRERFLDLVWGHTVFPTTRTVDTHIAGLRAKLEPDPEKPRWILTVHGVGYRLAVEESLCTIVTNTKSNPGTLISGGS